MARFGNLGGGRAALVGLGLRAIRAFRENRMGQEQPGRIGQAVSFNTPGPPPSSVGELPRTSATGNRPRRMGETPTAAPADPSRTRTPGGGRSVSRPGGAPSEPFITLGSHQAGRGQAVQVDPASNFGQAVQSLFSNLDPVEVDSYFQTLGVRDPTQGAQVAAALQQDFQRVVALTGGDVQRAIQMFPEMARNAAANVGLGDFSTMEDLTPEEILTAFGFNAGELLGREVTGEAEAATSIFAPVIDPRLLNVADDPFKFFE